MSRSNCTATLRVPGVRRVQRAGLLRWTRWTVWTGRLRRGSAEEVSHGQ